MKLVECVPNFSEGRNKDVINAIADSIKSVDGVSLLGVDPGKNTNRTVMTFVGSPRVVEEAAFKAIKTASILIDMSQHHGAHPRMGATDVCPLVPISGVSFEECIEMSHRLAKRVGDELLIPIYLYEKSASDLSRSNLADVRFGEYEALPKKLKSKSWVPDYGPTEFNSKSGATAIGVRNFLIAYNINLNTSDQRLATDIAFELREKGRSKRDPNPSSKNLLDGEIIRNKDGTPIKTQGIFKDVKAVGWYLDEYKRAQISINLNNYKTSSIHEVFDAACRLAEERGLRVTGSELVGLVPLDAILSAGHYYLKKQNAAEGIPENEVIECAIQSLGLNDLSSFDPQKKIIEYAISHKRYKLVNLSVQDLLDEISTKSPAPGGGSVSALLGSNAASLCSMVASLTYYKKDFFDLREKMNDLGKRAQLIKDELIVLIDEDTRAFNSILEANKLSAKDDIELEIKEEAIKSANELAFETPYRIASFCAEVLSLCVDLSKDANPSSISDVGVAAESAYAGFKGASMNVLINMPNIENNDFRSRIRNDLNTKKSDVEASYNATINEISKVLNS